MTTAAISMSLNHHHHLDARSGYPGNNNTSRNFNQKLASDAFLPSAAFDHFTSPPLNSNRYTAANTNSNVASFLSPLPSGFPPSALPNNQSNLPHSPSGSLPKASNQQYRNQSVPAVHGRAGLPPYHYSSPDVSSAGSLYRSISADATSQPAHLPYAHSNNNQLVQRLAQQNSLIREAWEAERNYLEANRRRAEEVYQEERVIMEEVREGWENEKATMLRENQLLKERIQRLEGENQTLRSVAAQTVQATGVMSPLASQRGSSVDTSVESGPIGHPLSQHHSHQSQQPTVDPLSLPPGLDGAARRPHHFSPNGGHSRTSPTGQPELSPFIPLDPRMQPQSSTARDFLHKDTIPEENENVPTIDIHEVDPKLEGISLRATALQRTTFGESNKGSPATSPPVTGDAAQTERPGIAKRLSSKDQTIQVLRAGETRRLTMHAGHTPNHSLSLFPTMSVAGTEAAGTQEGGTAPSSGVPSPAPEPEHVEKPDETAVAAVVEPPVDTQPSNELDAPDDENDELLEAAEDKRLKGPLMVKNIPAQDEIFWDRVNKKLEPISQGLDALPTVMRACQDVVEESGVAYGQPSHRRGVAHVDADASTLDDPESSSEKVIEGDVPLKLKTTTNFGAPFGMA
ncbi:uncharacterized protein J7T54_008497 [Emericellopsis cladophorae]|uniref:Uncharacterized protein n=1 Tax=Emericellopsis cladophorae TaxID=2686198 RepID=A0A9P9XZ57_9HYPO|nr:uncharacterized protein J7T54_008497 [Emericellopsis cladophorae]KAI6780579.1 hypothetical protein J7T54_008497 [Emericellopsis cladophorae]